MHRFGLAANRHLAQIGEPEDEPTAYLDLPRRVEIMRILRHLARTTGSAVLLSTHDLDLALRSADRIWLMRACGVVEVGAPEDLVLSGAFEATFHSEGIEFDRPLAAEPGVHVRYVSSTQELGRPDAVILPGTKSTIADLAWLRERGLAQRIVQLARENTPVVGICGGYQMLGQSIHDPDHVESSVGEIVGLGLLPIHTTFEDKKSTHRDEAVVLDAPGWLGALNGEAIYGYEIHMGQTSTASPWLEITQRNGQHVCVRDGAATSDGRIWGCYLHGIFENERLRRTWLSVGTCHTQPVNELRVGQRGVVVRVGGKGPARRRMMDMGLVPGAGASGGSRRPSPKPGDPSPCRSI